MIGRSITVFLVGLSPWLWTVDAGAQKEEMLAAAAAGDLNKVTELLGKSAILVAVKGENGQTPIQLATSNLHAEVVEKLLGSGAVLLYAKTEGIPLIHFALRRRDAASNDADRRLVMVELLLKYGADVRSQDVMGKTPVHLAVRNGHYKVLNSLVEAGADLMARDIWQQTPMHDAAMQNQIPMIDWLVASKVSVNIGDIRKETPLHSAVRRFRVEATERLITFGILVDAKSAIGQTALHLTGLAGPGEPEVDVLMTQVAEKLIAAGANLNTVDSAGHTPLHYALKKKRTHLVELLRAKGGKSVAASEE